MDHFKNFEMVNRLDFLNHLNKEVVFSGKALSGLLRMLRIRDEIRTIFCFPNQIPSYGHKNMKKKPTYEELEKRIKELERERQFEHDYLMSILGSIPHGIYSIDRHFNIRYLNPVVEEKLGPINGRKCYAYLHDRTEICPWCNKEEAVTGKSVRWDWCSPQTDKHYDLFDISLKNSDGSTAKFAISHDIIGLKWIQETMRKNMQNLTKRVKELNCFFGISTLVEKKGTSLEKIYQGTANILSQSFHHSDITCTRIAAEEKIFQTRNFKETSWKLARDIKVRGKPSGIIEVCYLEERPKCDEGPFLKEERALINAVAGRLGKIAELKLAEKKVLDSERRFRDLIENSPCGIIIIRNNKVVYRNPAKERLTGALEDPSLSVTFENIHSDDAQMMNRNYQKLVSGEKQHVEMEFRFYPVDKKGNRLAMKWVSCLARLIEYQGQDAILFNLTDVTLAKELDHILRIQDKMTSLGRVAAGVAHEIRNPLSGINIYLNTLGKISRNCENHEMISKIVTQLQSASNKIESVIKRVMDFSKPVEPRFVQTDINQPVKEAFNLSSVTLRKSGIIFSTDLSADLPKCKADPHMIEQVILNLIANASESMQNMDKDKKISISSFMENGAICISVGDSGPGVPGEIIDNIFDPFYTTKSNGSGIGLSICHRIITDHGGSIQISTAEPRGAEFVIRLPLNSQTGER